MKKFQQIYLEITNMCNLQCPFCQNDGRKSSFLSLLYIEQILDKIKDYTHSIYLHVKGEPMLHPEFKEILLFLKKQQINTKITTNGTFIDKYGEELIKCNNIHHINISLQASNTFDKIRKDQYFNKLFNFLDKLDNDTYVYLRDWVHDIDNVQRLKEKYPSFEPIGGYKISNNIIYSYQDEFEWPDINNELVENTRCLGGKNQLGILVNGDIVLCCLDSTSKTKVGNIFECNNLQEVLNSDLYQKAVSEMPYFELCKKCKFRLRFKE